MLPLEIPEARSRGYYLSCPHCRRELRLRLADSGRQMQCQLCGESFRFDPLDPQLPIQAVYVECPHCSDELRAAVKYLGVHVGCKRCGEPLLIPSSLTQFSAQDLEEIHDLSELNVTFDPSQLLQEARELSDLEITLDDNAPSPRALEESSDTSDGEFVMALGSDADAGDDVVHLEAATPELNETGSAGEDSATPPTENNWYCELLGQKLGPMSLEDLRFMAEHGELGPDDRVVQGETEDWRPAKEVVESFSHGGTSSAHEPVARDTHGLFRMSPIKPSAKAPAESHSQRPPPDSSPKTPSKSTAQTETTQVGPTPAAPRDRTAASAAPVSEAKPAEATKPQHAAPTTGKPTPPVPTATERPADASSSSVPTHAPPHPVPVSSPSRTGRHAAPDRGGVDLGEFLWPDATWIRVAIVVVVLSPMLAWGGWKLLQKRPEKPVVAFQQNTFDAETPTPVVLMAMLIKSGETIAYNGQSWPLTPLRNVVLDELGDKDAEGYQTAVVSFDRLEESRPQFHATVRLTFKLTELKMQGDLVVYADYDVKSVETLSTEAVK